MDRLKTGVNLTAHDDLFERLVALHRGLDEAECREIDARLIFLLVNHIGDPEVISAAIDAARAAPKAPG